MKVLSIDIGILHMGLLAAEINIQGQIEKIHDCDLVNITKECDDPNCLLSHNNCIADYMKHFFKQYYDVFEDTDIILIEQQPPLGLLAIQEIFRYEYGYKVQMISPRTVHCYLGIQHLDYEHRKVASETIAYDTLSEFKNFCFQERKHDMSDAYCQLKYWSYIKQEEYFEEQRQKEFKNDYKTIISNLDSFKFTM